MLYVLSKYFVNYKFALHAPPPKKKKQKTEILRAFLTLILLSEYARKL